MWGALDCTVVAVSLLSYCPIELNGGVVKALRAARVLRAGKLLSRMPSLRIVTQALLASLADSAPVAAFLGTLLVLFALVGMSQFSGLAYACNSDVAPVNLAGLPAGNLTSQQACSGHFQVSGDGCKLLNSSRLELLCRAGGVDVSSPGALAAALGAPAAAVFTAPRQWAPFPAHFATFLNALCTAFELMVGENWPAYMARYMHSTGAPAGNLAAGVAAYFLSSTLLLNQIGLEVFSGAMAVTFFTARKRALGLDLLTKGQQLWVENTRNSMRARASQPLLFVRWFPPGSQGVGVDESRQWVFQAATGSPLFGNFFRAVTLLNLLLMACFYTGMPARDFEWLQGLDNYITGVFLAEMVLLHYCLGARQYWRDGWMALDGLISSASVLSYLLNLMSTYSSLGATLRSLFRLARILRVLRVARSVPRLEVLINTLYLAGPAVLNILAMYCVCLFVFAVVSRGVGQHSLICFTRSLTHPLTHSPPSTPDCHEPLLGHSLWLDGLPGRAPWQLSLLPQLL